MKSIGKFQVLENLEGGATGQTYRTRDPFRKREFAVKVLKNIPDVGAEAKDQFCEYLTSCAQLTHHHIAKVDDLGEIDEGIFVATDWLSGMNLRDFMGAHQELALGRKLALIAQVAEGLAFAHSRGIVHGNLKPTDVFVDDVRDISILDFGAAKWLQALLQAGVRPEQMAVKYLAPEQILDQPFDARSDIFALGLILYEFASGRYPFSADAGVIPREIVHSEPEPLRQWDLHIPEALEQLVARALKKNPDERLQSADELASGLYLAARQARRLSAALPSAPSTVEQATVEQTSTIAATSQSAPAPPVPPAPAQEPIVPLPQAAVPMNLASPAAQEAPASPAPVRKRPQETESEPQPWTPRSYVYANSTSAATNREAPPVRSAPPSAATDSAKQAATDPPSPSATPPAFQAGEQPESVAPVSPQHLPEHPQVRKRKLTKGVLTTAIGLILAIVIVSSLMSRQNLRASQNKSHVITKGTESVLPISKPTPLVVADKTPAEPPANDPELARKRSLSEARWLWENGRYAKALALVDQVLAAEPTNEQARAWRKKIVDAQAAEAALK